MKRLWAPLVFSALLLPRPASDAASAGAPLGFEFSSISNRVITPNNDSKNDNVVIRYSNPQFSEVTGKIYDLRGGQVATMTPGPFADSVQWDGKSGGEAVRTGVYIYTIEAAGRIHRGTIMVVR